MAIGTGTFTTFSNVNDSSGGGAWSNPNNAATENTVYANVGGTWGGSAGTATTTQLLRSSGAPVFASGTPSGTLSAISLIVKGYLDSATTTPRIETVGLYSNSTATRLVYTVNQTLTATNTTYTIPLVTTTTVTNFPGTGASQGSGNAWTNPGNITADDTSYATQTVNATAANNQFIAATNFGFSIPTGNTIAGVKVEFLMRTTGNSGTGNVIESMYLTTDGTTNAGSNRGGATLAYGTTFTNYTFGTSSDLWGNTLTPSTINSSNFGARIRLGGSLGSVELDYVKISVSHYDPTAGGPITVDDLKSSNFYVDVKCTGDNTGSSGSGANIGVFIDYIAVSADVTAFLNIPVLSAPTITRVTSSTVQGRVSTTVGSGTLYYYASTNSTETSSTIIASGSSQTVTATGVQNITVSTLTKGLTYYLHFAHVATDGTSNVVTTSSFVPLSDITYVTGVTGSTTATISGLYNIGDLLVVFAYRDGNVTAPVSPGQGWTTLTTASGNTNSAICAWKRAQSTGESVGTWTNATSVIVHIYRNATNAGAVSSTTGTGTTVNYPALTLRDTSGASWVVGFAGHRSTDTALDTAPSGMTNRTLVNDATDEAAGHDTNGQVTTWASTNASVGGTGSGYATIMVELWSTGTHKPGNTLFWASP